MPYSDAPAAIATTFAMPDFDVGQSTERLAFPEMCVVGSLKMSNTGCLGLVCLHLDGFFAEGHRGRRGRGWDRSIFDFF